MSTLLLRLAGPMQSWGTESKFDVRKTAKEPSKSGVIGLLASALGRQRDEPVDDLVQLRFGVRVDREGILQRDYHTAKAKGDKEGYVTNRYYLADAVFLVGVEFDDTISGVDVKHECLHRHLLITAIGAHIIRMIPPLIINKEDCDKAVAIIREAVEALEK